MSLNSCIPGLEEEGKLDPARAAELRARYDELIAQFVEDASPETAEALASMQLLKTLESEAARKEFLAGRTIKARMRVLADLERFNGGRDGGPIDPRAGPAFLDHSERAGFSNVEARRKSVLGFAQRMLSDLMADHAANLMGKIRNQAQLRNIVRELFGESTGDATAKAMAAAWRKTAEMLRKRFNAAGGNIGFRTDWGLPQSHAWEKIRKAGFEKWREAILPRLDLSRMVDEATGLPITREKLELILPQIWNDIRSNGAASRTPGSPAGGKMLANMRADSRFFVFKSADDWLAYADEFGAGSAYDAMMGHITGMARDIAAIEVLGPNPQATLDWLKGLLVHSAKVDMDPGTKAIERARRANMKIDRLWDEYRGANLEPEYEWIALTSSTIGNLEVAWRLGGAFLSAVGDFGFQATTRAFNGLHVKNMWGDYLKMMAPGSIERQKMAVRRGLIAEEWINRTAAESRFMMEEMGSNFTRNLASGVLRLSLLSRHTQVARWVYGMETLASFTEAASKSFGELDRGMRAGLERYGMNAADWDKLRTAKMDMDGGVEWISPHNLDDQDLASRFMEMVHSETDFAVPVPDLNSRSHMNSKLQRGSVLGELGRRFLQFKSFGISVQIRQWQRIMAMPHMRDRLTYGVGLLAGTTMLGALAIQLKSLAAGKDPRPMSDPKFMVAAMQQGGGFGIMGDFLFSDQSRMGGSLAAELAGPMVADVQRLYNVAASENPEQQAVRTAKGFVPGNNIWWARSAIDRMLADQMNEMVNPNYRQSYRAMEQYAREQGTSHWWRPGDMTPTRAPDFQNAFEEGPQQ